MRLEKVHKLESKIIKYYRQYKVNIDIDKFDFFSEHGVERYIFKVKLLSGTKIDSIFKYAEDVRMRLKIGVFQPVKNDTFITIIVSDNLVIKDSLIKLLNDPLINSTNVPFILGYEISGNPVIVDIPELPHTLIGGSSRSGKTTLLKSLILGIALRKSPNKVNFIIFDIGAADLGIFKSLPHLSFPIIKDVKTGFHVLLALKDEMDRRMNTLSSGDRSRLPYIVCVIDEFTSLISTITDKRELQILADALSSLLRLGRHAKIHMVLAAQDPTIKNMKCDLGSVSARIALRCAKPSYSMTILGCGGAEKLHKGAMIFDSGDGSHTMHIQGAYTSPENMKKLVCCVKSGYQTKDKFVISEPEISLKAQALDISSSSVCTVSRDKEDQRLLAKIIIWSLQHNTISCNMLGKHFRLGFDRANSFIDKLHDLNLIQDKYAKLPRIVIPNSFESLTEDTVSVLRINGFSDNEIKEAFKQRNSNTI